MRDLEYNVKANDKSSSVFAQIEARAKAFNGEIVSVGNGLDVAGAAAKAFVGAFTLTAVAEFASTAREVIKQAADMVDLSNKVGVTTNQLQRLQYGFELNGVAAEDTDQILTQWSKRIGDAYTSGGKLAQIFKANNISLTDSNGHLRSSVDLMRDYADLVANAGSDQARTALATEAFGKAGAQMVLALRDGKAGFDELMRAADDAGGVIDDKLLQRAGELDDRLTALWHNFEINSKSALLTAIEGLDDLDGKLKGMDLPGLASLYAKSVSMVMFAGNDVTKLVEPAQKVHDLLTDPALAKSARLPDTSPIGQRIAGAFDTTAMNNTDADNALARALKDRYGTHTIIPNDAATRKASADAAKDQAKAYNDVIAKLRDEENLVGVDATTQKVLTEQRKAGVTATSQQGQAIEALVRRIAAENDAIEKAKQKQQEFQESVQSSVDAVSDTLNSIIDGSDRAATALAKLAANFAFAAAQAAIFGSGPLAGIFAQLGIAGSLGQASTFTPTTTLGGYLGAGSGTAAAAGKMAAQAPTIVHIHTPDAASFAKSRSQVETSIARAVGRARRSN